MNKTINKEVNGFAQELIKAIKTHESSWDDSYRQALARNLYCKWMGEKREDVVAQLVAEAINREFGFAGDQEISVEWFETQATIRRDELITAQETCCNEIERSKESLETATERKKAAQAAIDEGNSRLRWLARELKKPFISELPPAPNRQRELPLGDGEEWRAVPLADVLVSDLALKATVIEKLGNINLGQYAEAARTYGMIEKPKKLTRKQWDRVEAIVQKWHEDNAGVEKVESDEDEDE